MGRVTLINRGMGDSIKHAPLGIHQLNGLHGCRLGLTFATQIGGHTINLEMDWGDDFWIVNIRKENQENAELLGNLLSATTLPAVED